MGIIFKYRDIPPVAGQLKAKLFAAYDDTTGRKIAFDTVSKKLGARNTTLLKALRTSLNHTGFDEFYLEFRPINLSPRIDCLTNRERDRVI